MPFERVMSEEPWARWERWIREGGITLDRPRGSRHPRHPEIVYPIDYGYVNGTRSTDGEELDVFVGTAETGLVAVSHARDHRRGDAEPKLHWNCTPAEVYLVHGFLNFDPTRMEARLVMRQPMSALWAAIKR